ncbi:MAG TPA: hypothetical protein VJH92_05525 [Candidatus Nanoarchaeia archaeon]|nr:hypothetical protein [Candidatus Nanoarchaeia archaeon]
MNAQTLINKLRIDLEEADTIDFFESRVGLLTGYGAELPENLDYLRSQAVKRNIESLQKDIFSAILPNYISIRQKELDKIKSEYGHLIS